MSNVIPYKGNEPFIFISYSHKDTDRVLPIIENLQNEGFRVWYDDGIDPGTEWDEFIAEKLMASSFVVSMISENYLNSKNCKDELNFARDEDKEQLLIYLEEVELPAGMRMRFGRIQAIFEYRCKNKVDFYDILIKTPKLQVAKGEAASTVVDAPITPPVLPKPTPKTSPKPKTGESIQNWIKRIFIYMLSNKVLSKQEINLLHDIKYCKKTFGIAFPLFVDSQHDTIISGYQRYWQKPICGYYICSQWQKQKDKEYDANIKSWLVNVLPNYIDCGLERK